ncbi:DUF3095 domain-containing protein [Epibacterium sp. Ofav1-8]|uniref:DUF3095 domain-containing protein n=1 Tax=Epibacterium sp. Ofav1-8 TaxID=2917735 RepID=UPI001EF479B2|nr:DUF3095 domain-containing protein [Epibacterium sp. Ofav1-8]MCG7623554.1 DUF3095 domain-containing protein [Epibacterium sp. Ofav1-8]
MTLEDPFYAQLPKVRTFANLTRGDRFAPLPQDWLVGCCDIVDSTGLLAQGHYKTVNMVGASSIAALMNAFDHAPFPFVFGGDGTSFALPPQFAEIARQELAKLRAWVAQEFAVELRAALLPVAEVRRAGRDVRVARFAASEHLDYAMFEGGGLAWLEEQMKAGRFEIAPADPVQSPDLTGLSCRWNSVPAVHGQILSLLVLPHPDASAEEFDALVTEILSEVAGSERAGHPLPETGPDMQFPPPGLSVEARLSRRNTPAIFRTVSLFFQSAFAALMFLRKRPTGGFDPTHYRNTITANADFRKFDDGLKMTLDCSDETRMALEALLIQAQAKRIARYGLHAQDEALVTCIVPSPMQDDHMHFVDGASGGYARAAQMLKAANQT